MCILSLALEMKHRFPKSIFMHYFYFIIIKIRFHIYIYIYIHTHDNKEKKLVWQEGGWGNREPEGAKYLTTINNNIYYRYKIKNTNLKIIFTYNLKLNWQMSCRINWEQNIHDQRGILKPNLVQCSLYRITPQIWSLHLHRHLNAY
jgi:hypothetical protein